MIENFARAEQAVSETLLKLHEAGVPRPGTKLPHSTGQRFAAPAKILTSAERPLSRGPSAVGALGLFQRHESVRAGLVHGLQKIAIEQNGKWIVVIKMLTFKNAVSRSSATFDEDEASEALDRLSGDRQRLNSVLGQLRADLVARVRSAAATVALNFRRRRSGPVASR